MLSRAYDSHADEILGFLRRRVGCPQRAADLRQEVYLRLRQALQEESVGNPRAYLYRIALNLLVDARRQQTLERGLFDKTGDDARLCCPAPTPEAAAASDDELNQLQLALAELPGQQRDALLWYRLDGLTLREIGERLHVSESMAGRYVNRALAYCEWRLRRSG